MQQHTITDEAILDNTIAKLKKLYQEDKVAKRIQEERDRDISKLTLVFEAYSNGKSIEDFITGENGNSLPVIQPQLKVIPNEEFEYPLNATWANKIVAVFKYKNVALKISEIADMVRDYEKGYTDKKLTGVITNTINTNLVKNGILRIYTPPFKSKGFYYTSPIWWENDKLKSEYMPTKKEVKVW